MRAEPGEVLHFSEDPTITRFDPHVAATARQPDPYVWAVAGGREPDYWFPRQCPRVMAWARAVTASEDRTLILGPGGGDRVHVIEYGWLEALRTTLLYAYRFAAEDFRPFDGTDEPHAYVSERQVRPL